MDDEARGAPTVAQIASRAGVSTATFYKLFSDKEECFLAAYSRAADALVGKLERRIEDAEPSALWARGLESICAVAATDPRTIRLLTDEVVISTRRSLEARDQLLADLEGAIQHRARGYGGGPPQPDIPARMILGATLRLLLIRQRDPDASLEDLQAGLLEWVDSYRTPGGTPRWQALEPILALRAGPPNYAAGLAPPRRPPSGRSSLSPEQVAQSQRERILHAAAEVTATKGYVATSVADIVAAAGLAREVFYQHFRDKQDAFLSAYEMGFQALMSLVVGAFYSSDAWPERIWAIVRTYVDFMVNFPTFAHLGMVESHTVSPQIIARFDQRVMAFTVFLQKSYREPQDRPEPSTVVSEAVAMAMYEATAQSLRQGRSEDLPGLVPLMVYMILAPFIGPRDATIFVDGELATLAGTSPRPIV
jgi:AcrR family transcriptional regulator